MAALTIELASGSKAESETRDWLKRLLEEHDVSGWAFTLRVRVEEGAIPHSHPVLTLGTRSPHDWALLSSYLHEQLHWFAWERRQESDAALSEIIDRYPDPPIGEPDGARDAFSSHLHHLVNYLELETVSELLGADAAATYIRQKPFYRAIYATVVEDREWLTKLCRRCGLVLPDRRTGAGTEWFHGSPLPLDVLREGSTVTRNRDLARIFSHKPRLVSIDDDGSLRHNGSGPGFLYRVDDAVTADNVEPHPMTTMEPGMEWLTKRPLRLERIAETTPLDDELLSEQDVAEIQERAQRQASD